MSTVSQKSNKEMNHNDSVVHIKHTTDTINEEKKLKKVNTDGGGARELESDFPARSSSNLSAKKSQLSKRSTIKSKNV